jgi:hypothetical protein
MPSQLPAFLVKHNYYNVAQKITELIAWSKAEYNRAVVDANRRKSVRVIMFLQREYSALRILAECEGFIDIIHMLNDENYNALSGRDRVFLRRAYEIYKSLT